MLRLHRAKPTPVLLSAALSMMLTAAAFAAGPTGAAEPRELLERQAKAIAVGDKAMFLSTYSDASAEDKSMLTAVDALFDGALAARQFSEKLTKTYGPESLTTVGLPRSIGIFSQNPDSLAQHAKDAKINIKDDTASTVGFGTNDKEELTLVKRDGQWLVDPLGSVKGDKAMALAFVPMMTGMMKSMTQAIKDVTPMIGKAGETPDTIRAALDKKKEAMGMGAGNASKGPNAPDAALRALAEKKGTKTPLHNAVSQNNADEIKKLVEAGADVNANDEFGNTPLFDAVWRCDPAIVKLLLDKGADPNDRNTFYETPLFKAAFFNKDEAVDLLLKHGADVKIVTPAGTSIANNAASSGNQSMLEKVLAAGAPLAPPGGRPALHDAANSGRIEMLDYLLKKGADIGATDNLKNTAFHAAASAGQGEAIKWLLAHGAKVDVAGFAGKTALHCAAASYKPDAAQALLAAGADVNAKSDASSGHMYKTLMIKHYTPLHEAAMTGNADVIRLLLDKGADINATEAGGKTALAIATELKRDDIVTLLKEHGAK